MGMPHRWWNCGERSALILTGEALLQTLLSLPSTIQMWSVSMARRLLQETKRRTCSPWSW